MIIVQFLYDHQAFAYTSAGVIFLMMFIAVIGQKSNK